MSDECKVVDPTAFGLFVVAIISLPLALMGLKIDNYGGFPPEVFLAAGVLLLITAGYAYKVGASFGFAVFGLVAFGVFLCGYGIDAWVSISLGIVYLICLVWSARLKNLKNLTLILLTTALIFIAQGIFLMDGAEWALTLLGIAALGNFILCLYLAFALADEHLPCF